jgi:hypothetical protein
VLTTIKELASRMLALRPETPPQATLYNFTFGALEPFARTVQLGFANQYLSEKGNNQLSLDRAKEVTQLATSLSETGTLPTGGKWLAGHYYNSSLLRVDVCYEQAVRYYLTKQPTETNKNVALITSLRIGYPPDLIVPFWPKVRRQVNSLKHNSISKTEGPSMPPDELLKVIERLIGSVEWLFIHGPAPKEPRDERY